MAGIELRPRSTSEIVDAAIQLVRGHYLAYVMIAALVNAPAIAYATMQFNVIIGGGPARINWPAAFLSFGVSTSFGLLNESVSIAAMSRPYLGEPLDIGGALATALRRIIPLILAQIVRLIAMGVGFLLFVVPGIYIGVRTYCLDAVVMLEDASSPFTIFGRSWRLSEKDAMHIFLAALLSTVFVIVGVVAGGLLATALAAVVPGLGGPRMHQLFQSAFVCFVAPIGAAVITVLYYDLRIRREGFDLELSSKALGTDAAAR